MRGGGVGELELREGLWVVGCRLGSFSMVYILTLYFKDHTNHFLPASKVGWRGRREVFEED